MAIRQVQVCVPLEGADKGKTFVITRMSAMEADRWGRHCLQAAIASGADIPGLDADAGLAGLAAVGLGIFWRHGPRADGRVAGPVDAVCQRAAGPAQRRSPPPAG
ncbi:hypothetical protein [Acetobacter ghanensis]|uniref:hypothetical protein n=1 Tax=Acetobacter ghanensis TaxID=431306 RepID=UPI00073F006F|nr:hypothetical protein [Acetobacter ghanensis]